MIFNSIEFLIFFFSVFVLYWMVFDKNIRYQNILLLGACYFFYAWWDWRFLSLIIVGSLINYWLGIAIYNSKNDRQRKFLLLLGILQSLGGLIFFKYCNFFIESFQSVFTVIGLPLKLSVLNIIVPLGISFYTFRVLSYLLDIKNGKDKPTRDWIVFFIYVSFFPTFISGPIDRAKHFIPQLIAKRVFDYSKAVLALQQILWGLFKKMVIADNLAIITAQAFDQTNGQPGSMLFIGAIAFAIEVYADFSGYSDMAIGFALLLGFSVSKNFDFPYFSQNVAEFWRKWHISLTSWLTEYVFTPLTIAFRDWGQWGIIAAIVINMVVCGFWHGANWTFIIFGFLQGLYFIPLILNGKLFKKKKAIPKGILAHSKMILAMIGTFLLIAMTDVLFRCENLSQAAIYYRNMFSTTLFQNPILNEKQILAILLTFLFIAIEWWGKNKNFAIENIGTSWPRIARWSYYSFLLFLVGIYMNTSETSFIYFKF